MMTLRPSREQPRRRWTLSFERSRRSAATRSSPALDRSSPRHVVVTGPYRAAKAGSGPRWDGTNVEVFLGRLDESLTRISPNDRGDFYPAAWVGPGEAP